MRRSEIFDGWYADDLVSPKTLQLFEVMSCLPIPITKPRVQSNSHDSSWTMCLPQILWRSATVGIMGRKIMTLFVDSCMAEFFRALSRLGVKHRFWKTGNIEVVLDLFIEHSRLQVKVFSCLFFWAVVVGSWILAGAMCRFHGFCWHCCTSETKADYIHHP